MNNLGPRDMFDILREAGLRAVLMDMLTLVCLVVALAGFTLIASAMVPVQ